MVPFLSEIVFQNCENIICFVTTVQLLTAGKKAVKAIDALDFHKRKLIGCLFLISEVYVIYVLDILLKAKVIKWWKKLQYFLFVYSLMVGILNRILDHYIPTLYPLHSSVASRFLTKNKARLMISETSKKVNVQQKLDLLKIYSVWVRLVSFSQT